ncbi:glycosyltransferase family protein [Halorussus amylolyticus]|uniref:hypothetical protein n=1 Tax=Halorussus amylolyticus TaxID=1126242 RepID=UPI001050388F|nr:hypothetical protein [Halorussus amylolyticus]
MVSFEIPQAARRRFSFGRVGTLLLYAVPTAGLAGLAVPYLLGFETLAILATYIAVPCLVAPVLYYYATGTPARYDSEPHRSERRGETATRGHSDLRTEKLLASAFFVLQAIAVFLLVSTPVRPYSYYVVVALSAGVVLAQILFLSSSHWRAIRILSQIALLNLNVLWGVTFKYNFYIGRTDILGHAWLVQKILRAETTVGQFSGFYRSFPLWHVLGSMEHLLAGSPWKPRMTLFAISGLLFCFAAIGVFLTSMYVFGSYKVGLVAALLTCLHPNAIANGMYAIPRSAASFFFVILLLLWVKNDRRSILLFAALTMVVAAYHTASLPFVFLILSVEYGIRKVALPRADDVGTTYRVLVLVAVIQAFYWVFFADYLIRHVLGVMFQSSTPGAINSGIIGQPVTELLNYLHHSMFLILILVGVLTALTTDRLRGRAKVVMLSALCLAAVTFPGPQLLLGKLAESFNILRFAQYTYPFMAMAGGYGLVALYRRTASAGLTGTQIRAIAFAVFLLLSMFTVSNDFTASDNPLVERQFYTYYVADSEEESMQTIAGMSSGNVLSDYVTERYLSASPYERKGRVLGVNEDADRMYLGGDENVVLVREGELERRSVQLRQTDRYRDDSDYLGSLRYVAPTAPVWNQTDDLDRVFDSGSVVGYKQSPVVGPPRNATVESSARNSTAESARRDAAGVSSRAVVNAP